MGGGGVSAPKPGPEELALRKAELDMVNYQRSIMESTDRQLQVFTKPFLEEEGYDVLQKRVTTPYGDRLEIGHIYPRYNETKALQKEAEKEFAKRSLLALKGELPVDPALERDIASQRETLQTRLQSQFGSGASTSSPAMEALQRFDESSNILREGARTGQMTLSEQLGMAREQQNAYSSQSKMDFMRQIGIGDPMAVSGGFSSVANNYLKAQQPYIQDRQMALQASIANQQARTSMFGAGIGLAGSLFSDADIKGDLVQVSTHPIGVPVYMYTRKDTGERMIGVLAQDVAKVKPWAVTMRDGYLMVDYEEL